MKIRKQAKRVTNKLLKELDGPHPMANERNNKEGRFYR